MKLYPVQWPPCTLCFCVLYKLMHLFLSIRTQFYRQTPVLSHSPSVYLQIGAQMLFLKLLSNHHSAPKALSTALRGRSDYSISGSDFHCQLYYLLTLSLHSLHELLANLQIPQAPWTRLTLFLLSGMPSLCPCSFHPPSPYSLFYVSLWTCIIFSPIFDKSEIY